MQQTRSLLLSFVLTVVAGALIAAALYAAASGQDAIATLAAAFLAVILAGAQILIMYRQTRLMEKQDELLLRRASLNAFGNVVSDLRRYTPEEYALISKFGSSSSLTTQIYVVNTGSRAANGFRLSVQVPFTPTLRDKSDTWQRYEMESHTLFVFESAARVFPGDVCIVQQLCLIAPGNAGAPEPSTVRVAYEDGETGWITLRDYREMPEEFKVRLAGQIQRMKDESA